LHLGYGEAIHCNSAYKDNEYLSANIIIAQINFSTSLAEVKIDILRKDLPTSLNRMGRQINRGLKMLIRVALSPQQILLIRVVSPGLLPL